MAQVLLSISCFLLLIGSSLGQFRPSAVLYSGKSCTGAFVTLSTGNYAPDLSRLGFNNRAYSASLSGTWLFFDSINFNAGGNALMEYVFEPTTRCVNFYDISGYISSVKYVGTDNDYRQDTITFYEYTYFQATEEYLQYDMPNLSLRGRIASLIITGSSSWTIYDKSNYGGNAICLQPEYSPNYAPAFVPDTLKIDPTVPHGSIQSVRRGCYTDKVIKIAKDSVNSHVHAKSLFSNPKFTQVKA